MRDKADDDYVKSLAETLDGQPADVIREMVSVKGIVAECKWLPTIADIVKWMEARNERIARRQKEDQRYRKYLEEMQARRDETDAAVRSEEDKEEAKRLVASLKRNAPEPHRPKLRPLQCPPGWAIKEQMRKNG